MNEKLTNISIKLSTEDWAKMGEIYGKNRAEIIRQYIKKLIAYKGTYKKTEN